MEIKIVAVGKIRDRCYLQKIEDYAERIRHDVRLSMVEIKDTDPEREGEKITDHLGRERAQVIALDERGRLFSSVEFAKKLASIPRPIVFVIGGPSGLSDRVKRGGYELMALSPMTFPHEMARLLLLEQLYRAISIIKNRKYHK